MNESERAEILAKDFLVAHDIMQLCGVTRKTVIKKIASGELDAIRPGSSYMIVNNEKVLQLEKYYRAMKRNENGKIDRGHPFKVVMQS